MATPTNLKTGTVDIGVNAYSKPVNTAAIEAVGTGMELWAKESRRRFDEAYEQDLKNLRTLQETDPIVKDSIAASELLNKQALQGGLNEADARTLKALESDYRDLDFLLEQGKKSWNMYRLRGSNLLRNAIMLRPDLGDEFRNIASKHLGTDVNNAFLEIWSESQSRMEKQLGAGKTDGKSRLNNATFESYLKITEFEPDVMVQQKNRKIISNALDLWRRGEDAAAEAMLDTVSWGGSKNPAIAARAQFLDVATQQDFQDTTIRFASMAKQAVFDPVAFEAEIPQLKVKKQQLEEWKSAILSDNSNLINDKEDLVKRIDAYLNPINQLLATDSDEERGQILKNAVAQSEFRLKPTATQLVSEINPYAPVGADTAALVMDGLAIYMGKTDKNGRPTEYSDYIPTAAYLMTKEQMGVAFSPVLINTENAPKKAVSTTKALTYMMLPYAEPKQSGGQKMMQNPQQMYNLVQLFNSSNGELLARSEVLAKQAPELLYMMVTLRYGMITEMQRARFSGIDPELAKLIEVPDVGQTYKKGRRGIPNEGIQYKISSKATPEQRARIMQWGKENPPALNAVAYQQFVNDTLTMAGRVQGVK